MKRAAFFLLSVLVLTAGCHQAGQKAGSGSDEQPSQVILLNAKRFPSSLTGIWENEENGWILRIESDGRVSKIRHTIGRVALKAGEITTFPLINNGSARVEPGPWYSQYDGIGDMVTIEINIKEFIYNIGGGNIVQGSSRDVFIGTPPLKNDQTWTVQWISYPEFVASTGDRQFLDYKLPFEQGDEDKGEIIFKRVSASETAK